MQIRTVPNGPLATNSYILTTDDGAYLIDAPSPSSALIQEIEALGLPLLGIWLTHGHFDHVMALSGLKKKWPEAEIAIATADAGLLDKQVCNSYAAAFGLAPADQMPGPDRLVSDSDMTPFGFTVISTPGHTPGSICLYSSADRILFTGDTLFESGVGRTDLGGNWHDLMASLKKLDSLVAEDDVRIFPGHGGFSTMGRERTSNPYLRHLG